jgi:glycosyltransferase involved in cell wall biosynthesis
VFVASNPWGYGGGSEFLWQEAAAQLMKAGHPVLVCAQDHGPLTPELERLRAGGAEFILRRRWITREDPNPNRRDWRERFGGWFGGPASQYQAIEQIAARKPSLVVVNQCENADGAWCIAGLAQRRLPFVVLFHNGGPGVWPQPYDAELLTSSLPAAEVNYFCSKHNVEWLETQLGITIPKVKFFFNPVKVSRSEEPRWPDSEALNIAMVGRLDPRSKGHDLAFAMLSEESWHGRNVRLNLYGDGPYAAALKRLTARRSLMNVHFHGHVGDVDAIWRANHLLLQPSRHEGLPSSLVEAMHCARPAVVTDVGGSADLVEDGVSGFVAARPDLSSVADAMERCWQRRDEWHAMGLAARRRVESVIPADPVVTMARELLELANLADRSASHGSSS